MNKSLILIKNNGKMKTIKEKKVKDSDLQDTTYILFYSDKLNSSLLMISPKFIEFDKATIRFRMSVGDSWMYEQTEDEERSCAYYDEATFEVHSFKSLCESLFMLCYTSTVNQINNGMDVTTPSNVLAMVQYIDLEISRDNKVIYKKQYLEKDPLNFLYREYSYFRTFKKIFHPVDSYENIKIDTVHNRFHLTNDPIDVYDKLGINLNSICSYLIVPREYELLIDKIDKVYYGLMIWSCKNEKYEDMKNKISLCLDNIIDSEIDSAETKITDFMTSDYSELYQYIPQTILGYGADETISNLFSITRFIDLIVYYIRFVYNIYLDSNDSSNNIHSLFIFNIDYKKDYNYADNRVYYIHDNDMSNSNLSEL